MDEIRNDDPTDAELAQRILREGDEAAFRALYRRHTGALYQFALRILGGSEMDAEDIVQETWIRAVAGLTRFRWESSFRTWLIGIGLNRVRKSLRRVRPAQQEDLERLEAELVAPDRAGRIDLEQAVRLLPDGYRAVLVLHDVEGFTHDEISRSLGITPGTSRSQLHFARRAVRRLLGAQGGQIHDARHGHRADS
ncbi:MAG TPA: sigma-70 family RNA polymerase sigma factor [Thermoanaerobaculia bacterium]